MRTQKLKNDLLNSFSRRQIPVCRDVNFVMEERKMKLVKAEITDIEEISKLYDDVCDYLFEHENYPG